MKFQDFSVTIPEGKELKDGYVQLAHATVYTIELRNEGKDRCDAEVHIDGQQVGIWRVKDGGTIRLERPVHDTGRFTFYAVDTPEAAKAGIYEGQLTGIIRVLFKPEYDFGDILSAAGAPEVGSPGGTGLSGRSDQKFTDVTALDYDEDRFITINLRLVASVNEPRPLFPRSTPVPPPVR